ncbi:MAG: aminotransferase class IV [Acidimicrobiia bacterium]|nr:aminotransferase class IV [Acidimicrobiia bacterium]
MIIWLNGDLIDAAAARVSPLDRGLLVGDGVFETLRVYGGVPFAWSRHLARLAKSAGGLGLEVPDPKVLRGAADAVISSNHLLEARLRITVTGGEGPPGTSRAGARPTVLVVATPFVPWSDSVDVVIVPWSRNEGGAVAGLKTISYAENVRALAYAEERGAGEAIFPNTRGVLCEATGSNLFVARGGVLRTPPASSGCLLGVTRALILDVCTDDGVPVEETDLSPDDLVSCDEAFLSSTTREVHPIARVDGVTLPGAPGAISLRAAAGFRALVARDLDP